MPTTTTHVTATRPRDGGNATRTYFVDATGRLIHTLHRPDTFAARRASTLFCDWRRAWMGGEIPDANDRAECPIYRELVHLFMREELVTWRAAWAGNSLTLDTARTFYRRARYDAWRTFTRARDRGDIAPDSFVDSNDRVAHV